MKLTLKPYQAEFHASQKRYPALVAGIGTGKTLLMLLKVWEHCEKNPNALVLVVRKEYTDLRDSTISDFEKYFSVKIDSNKEYTFPNGSRIMFRHASELDVLKNVNLSMFAIEQAEEFEDEEQFMFLRDRLRRKETANRQGLIIANARGHNWIWRMWINNPGEEFHAVTATTFDNADNLPTDFIIDLKSMEKEAPAHYKQYVLNSFEDLEEDDLLFDFEEIQRSYNLDFGRIPGGQFRVLSADIARYGEDKSVITALESRGALRWEQVFIEHRSKQDLMQTTGWIIDTIVRLHPDIIIVDGDGLGAGVVDRLKELRQEVLEFRGGKAPRDEYGDKYINMRSEAYLLLKDWLQRGHLKLMVNAEQEVELQSIRYMFDSRGRKAIVSKEKMKKDGIKSPDFADALAMAVEYCDVAVDRTGDHDKATHKAIADTAFNDERIPQEHAQAIAW